ncbi:Transmembrane protease serine 11A [Lonchura striata]|uniref:Transmembrane protease serine 11A n=1 Tax=Lonchura striata TaxID=40157 RepID=A0A218UMF2_9PASE|nr:Transmembrane protease serine 11A [Lonchura striata domestica]
MKDLHSTALPSRHTSQCDSCVFQHHSLRSPDFSQAFIGGQKGYQAYRDLPWDLQNALRDRYYTCPKTVVKCCQSKHAFLIRRTRSRSCVIAHKRSSLEKDLLINLTLFLFFARIHQSAIKIRQLEPWKIAVIVIGTAVAAAITIGLLVYFLAYDQKLFYYSANVKITNIRYNNEFSRQSSGRFRDLSERVERLVSLDHCAFPLRTV